MRIISIINQKGGCGKTTSSINLAACLARLGQKTLLVDMDPQGHCGIGLAVPEEQIERTIYDALIEPSDGRTAKLSEIVWQIASDFDLAPSTIKLAAFEQVFAGRQGRENRLAKALESVKDNYNWVILDCPPSVGLLTFNALKASDQVIVPVETGFFSLHGLTKMMETLETLKERANRDILIRVLPTLYDTRTKLAREVLSELRLKFRDYLMESVVNFNTKLKEAASFGQPITEYDPGSRGYKDFVNLARELMGHRPLDVEAATGEKLSRPAELVQRARQLSQLTNFQFGRNIPSQNPSGLVNGSAEPIGGGNARFSNSRIGATGAAADEMEDAANGMPHSLPSGTPSAAASTLALASPKLMAVPSKSKPTSTLELAQEITSELAPVMTPVMTPAMTSPMTSVMTPVMLPAMALAEEATENRVAALQSISASRGGAFEGMRLGSAAVTAGSGVIVASAASLASAALGGGAGKSASGSGGAASLKSTARKIDEFYGVKQVGEEVHFTARFEDAKRVLIAGDFNNWAPGSTPMQADVRSGNWRMRLPLRPGRYRYRFVVDGRWVTDPHNKHVEVNQFGELNNVVEVTRIMEKAA